MRTNLTEKEKFKTPQIIRNPNRELNLCLVADTLKFNKNKRIILSKKKKRIARAANDITHRTLEQVNFVMKANQKIVIKTGIGNDACMMYTELNMVYCKKITN